MNGAYSLFRLAPIHVHGKGEVAPEGYVSDAQCEMMEAAQTGQGPGKCMPEIQEGTPTAPADPWGDLR